MRRMGGTLEEERENYMELRRGEKLRRATVGTWRLGGTKWRLRRLLTPLVSIMEGEEMGEGRMEAENNLALRKDKDCEGHLQWGRALQTGMEPQGEAEGRG